MKNVDDAIKILTDAIPGLLVTSYEKTGNDTFSMKLELAEKVVPCEGHINRLRNIDAAFRLRAIARCVSKKSSILRGLRTCIRRCMPDVSTPCFKCTASYAVTSMRQGEDDGKMTCLQNQLCADTGYSPRARSVSRSRNSGLSRYTCAGR